MLECDCLPASAAGQYELELDDEDLEVLNSFLRYLREEDLLEFTMLKNFLHLQCTSASSIKSRNIESTPSQVQKRELDSLDDNPTP